MKFAFVSTMASVPWGGSEMLWSEAAQHLAAMGNQVYASVPEWPQTPKKISELQAIFGIHVWERSHKTSILRRGLKRVMEANGQKNVYTSGNHWLKRVKPDLICISSGNATEGLPWMKVAESLSIPYVFIAQAHAEFLWPSDEYLDQFRHLFDKAEKCFFVSSKNLQLFETQIAHTLKNSEIVFNPFNVSWDFRFPWPKYINGTYKLACVGRLHPPSKGQDILLSVLKSKKWKSRPIELSFFGQGPHESGLSRLIEQYNLNNIVKLQGYTTEVDKIWRDHHALILPSRYEGLPLAIVEAMICKRPIITTNVAGNAELLEDSVTGFVAEAATVLHLDQAMERAWEAREHWEDMGRKARQMISHKVPKTPGLEFAEKMRSIAIGIC